MIVAYGLLMNYNNYYFTILPLGSFDTSIILKTQIMEAIPSQQSTPFHVALCITYLIYELLIIQGPT